MLRNYFEVPAKRLLYLLVALVLCVDLYDWAIRPPTTEKLAASTIGSVVLIECEHDSKVAITGGFVASDYGHIITVAHGLSNCLDDRQHFISVKYLDDPSIEYRAIIVRYNKWTDVALLQTPSHMGVPPLEMRIDTPEVGSAVLAIGHPESLYWSVTPGIIAADRPQSDGTHLIQVTSPLNHGNSGGPILDAYGRVIGVADLMVGNATLGIVIPADILSLFLNGTYH